MHNPIFSGNTNKENKRWKVDRMRKKKVVAFFTQKSYVIAAVIMVMAAFGMTGLYYSQQNKAQEQKVAQEQKEQVQQAKTEDLLKAQESREKAAELARVKQEQKEKAEETEAVSGIIPPVQETVTEEPQIEPSPETEVIEPTLHFNADMDLLWPLQGNVIMNYSMDQTIYFATLDQYKYNPAVIIQSEVNNQVTSVAQGQVTAIDTNEETGATMTVELGDGYSAVYGQLKEIPQKVGDYVESGEIIGYVNEPTKYYSVEGSNLYFELTKDGAPVNPMEYIQE